MSQQLFMALVLEMANQVLLQTIDEVGLSRVDDILSYFSLNDDKFTILSTAYFYLSHLVQILQDENQATTVDNQVATQDEGSGYMDYLPSL